MKALVSFALLLFGTLSASAQYDTVIVGGGLSGLAAAVELQKEQNVLVVESADRPGGRIQSVQAHGIVIENGAEFIDRENKYLQDLIRRYGLELIELDKRPDKAIFSFGGRTYSQSELSEKIFSENETAIKRILELRSTVKMSIAQAVNAAGFNEFAKNVFSTLVRSETGRSPEEISFKEFKNYFFRLDVKKRTVEFLPYADESLKLKGGTERLIAALAGDLKAGTVSLNTRVLAVKTARTGFELVVETPRGTKTISSRELVVTVPPHALKDIRFELGAEPESALRKIQEMPFARNTKLYLFFNKKRWLELGLSGAGWSEKGFQFFETSQGQDTKNGALLAYSGESLKTAEEKAKLVERTLEELDRIFPGLRKDYIGHRLFHFPRSYSVQGLIGSPQSVFLEAARKLPFRLIGEGFSTVSPGYMDGAAETAAKAARDILLQARHPGMNRCARAVVGL